MSKLQKKLLIVTTILAFSFGIMPVAYGMHIMEGYLPVGFCVAWGVICIPFLLAGFFSIRKTIEANRKTLVLLALSLIHI